MLELLETINNYVTIMYKITPQNIIFNDNLYISFDRGILWL